MMLLLMIFLLFAGEISGAESVGARKVVRIPSTAVDRMMVLDESGNPVSGYAYDYIQLLGAYAGWDLKFVPCDAFLESVEKLLSGEVDLFYDISHTEERAKLILFPNEPMGNEYYYLYALDGNASIVPGDYASMKGKSVGLTKGTMQVEILKEWCKKKNVDFKFVEYETIEEKEADLRAGKIDLDLEVSMLIKRGFSAIEKVGMSPYYLVVNRNRRDLLDDINSALEKILNNDPFYFSRLQDRYFSDTMLSSNLTLEERNWIASHKVLRVGYFDKYLPFSSRDEKGQPIGAGIDAVRQIIARLKLENDVKVEFICYDSQKSGYKAVESGEIDLMFPAYISNTVRRDYDIIGGKVFATLASDLVYVGEFGDGKGRRIGVNKNNLMQFYYSRDAYPRSRVVPYESIQECLDGLLAGSADGTFLNGLRTDALLKPGKYHSLKAMRARNGFEFRMAFSENNLGLMLLMDRGLTLLDPDFFNKAAYAYAGQMNPFSIMDYLREHILSAILAVALLVGLIVSLLGYRFSNRKLEGINRELTEYSETIEKQRQQESELRVQLEKKQDEIEGALHMAQAANRAKTIFLNNMSHDIRTPMNAIIGFTGLAASNINDTPRVQEYLATIARSSEHLLSLINDVLDMSHIESGKMTLHENEESLSDILKTLREIVHAEVQEKHHEFSIDTEGVHDNFVYCDKLRFNQVLLNLVSNAIKYTPSGGRISLRVIQKAVDDPGYGVYEIRCKDNGIGMSEEFAKTIFDPFTREENSTMSGVSGTGLGMAITKNIVEMMGGRISVASRKGEGTEFTVFVRLRLADRKASATEPAKEKEVSVDLKGKKVLLVDDSPVNLKVGLLHLQRQGMVVDTASNGKIAVDMIREKGTDAYDFILMDVQMPVMDGYEATAAIRQLPGGGNLKIIAFSANAFDEDREKSFKAGMDGHIAKPLLINELLKELKRLLA